MIQSLQFRFISILLLLSLSIAALTYIQYSASIQTHKLFESQLTLKELHIQYLKMQEAKANYFLNHKEHYIEDLMAYSDTLDLYLSMVDEYLDEFTYTPSLKNDINAYLDTFLTLTQKKYQQNRLLQEELEIHSKKINTFIRDEQLRLIPIITHKIDKIENLQISIYFLMLISILIMLYNIFKPILRAILIFKSFFATYSSPQDRLDVEKLYFKEIAISVNSMLENQEQAQKVKDEFLSNMSHELRTPLNAIGGFAGILKRKFPQEKETIVPIVESSNHLLQLVSDILDLSKIQSGKFEIVEESFGLYGELEHFNTRFTPQLNKKNIHFIFNYNADKNLRLMGDWFRVSQILNNFMSNALKFTPDGGKIQLDISYDKGRFYASVTDNGIGIKEESLKTILKPFEQSDKSVTKKFGGTGLGLSIAKTLTEMMGGTFNVKSRLGMGSTFSVSIAFKEIEPQRLQGTDQESQEEEEEASEVNFNIHVLIAEDNKTNQMLLGMLLDDLGVSFDTANDGQEALDMFEEGKYAMILMDENMPNLSGTDSMLAIREKFNNVPPIIAVTANAMKGDREKLLALGMDDFLSKPIDNDLLIAVIKRNLP